MPTHAGRRHARLAIASLTLFVLALGVWTGPTVAFHVLPFSLTGEDARLASVLRIGQGSAVAEIGAGEGELSAALARRVGPGARFYSTELSAERRREIQDRANHEGLRNLVVVEAGETATGLPDGCCDAIVMRMVYHHIGDPARLNQSIRQALRPGGRLAISDFRPSALFHTRPPASAAAVRTGHGVDPETVAGELRRAGFELEHREDNWGGRLFLVVFRLAAPTLTDSGTA